MVRAGSPAITAQAPPSPTTSAEGSSAPPRPPSLEAFPVGLHPRFAGHEEHQEKSSSIRDIVFGMTDGAVTTLGVAAGAFGAFTQSAEILLAGVAAAIAGTCSMFFSAFLSYRSARQVQQREVDRELYEMEHLPHIEREELVSIYQAKGFKEDQVRMIVDHLTSNRDLWLKTMLLEELGIIPEKFDRPLHDAGLLGIAYLFGAFVPLLPFLAFTPDPAVLTSMVLGAGELFVLGWEKARLAKLSKLTSAAEIVGIALGVAALSYLVVTFFESVVA